MQIDISKSKVNFTIKKLLFLTVKGILPEIKGSIKLNEDSLSDSKIDIVIPLEGIDTNNVKRNDHLLEEDFFNINEYPEIIFESNEVYKENEYYFAKGNLSIAGTIKEIEIPFQFSTNQVTGSFSLDRTDFKVGKVPAFVASNNVDITFELFLDVKNKDYPFAK